MPPNLPSYLENDEEYGKRSNSVPLPFFLRRYTYWYTTQVYNQFILFKSNNLTEIKRGVSHPLHPRGIFRPV